MNRLLTNLDRAWLTILASGLVALCGSAAVGFGLQIHEPRVNDEFSYLLAADTFARGRLTNPPNPMWLHLEAFHVLQQPTYASKYPPAQGLALAAGKVLTGLPIAGVWASAACMCAAAAWMLLAWFPARWALLGGLILALRFGIVGYWSQSYWGGAVPATGGALLIGALPRIARSHRIRDALWMGLGVVILANSRPYEGLVMSLPAAAVVGILSWRRGLRDRTHLLRTLLPLSAVLGLGFLWMAYYNWRVTGDPFSLSYSVHDKTYSFVPLFLFQELRPVPIYHHEMIEKSYTKLQLGPYRARETPAALFQSSKKRLSQLWRFYLGTALSLPLLALYTLRRNRWVQYCMLTCVLMGSASLVATYSHPHYVAPATGALLALLVGSLQQIAKLRWRAVPVGSVLIAAIIITTFVRLAVGVRDHPVPEGDWSRARARLLAQLSSAPGRHLVLVRYDSRYNPQADWVHNGADIESAKVVWARAMQPQQDREVLDHFRDRRAWLLEVDPSGWRFSPYLRNPDLGSKP